MDNKPKFVLIMLKGLPEKEKVFVRKILDDFWKIGAECIEDKSLDMNNPDKLLKNSYNKDKRSDLVTPPEPEKISIDVGDLLKKELEVGNVDFAINKSKYKPQDGLMITSAAYFNESLLNSGITTIVYDKNLGHGLPYGLDLVVESFEEVDADFLIRLWKHKNKIPCLIAETKRTIIKELCEKDINEVIKISREEHILKFVEDGRGPEEEQKEKLLAYIRNVYRFYDYGIWGIFDREDNSLIGVISLDLLTNTEEAEYETGFFIRKERLGQGFAAEGLKTVEKYVKDRLSASKLTAVTNCENKAAMALLKKSGFTAVGQNDKIIFEKQLND